MKGDFSRLTFRRNKHYNRVLMQQGRVQLDADFNEQQAIRQHRDEIQSADVIGPAGTPRDDPGFAISIAGNKLRVGAGRMYVDGLLVENESTVDHDAQPHLHPGAAALLTGNATVGLVVLDVWEEPVTPYDDPDIKEIALGGPDTALRSRVTWQVKVLPLPKVAPSAAERAQLRALADTWRAAQQALAQGAEDEKPKLRRQLREAERRLAEAAGALGLACGTPYEERGQLPALSAGMLTARTNGDAASTGDDSLCVLAPTSGYTGLGNQLYRVEIHTGGNNSQATFKWSSENASIEARVTDVSGSVLTVDTTGRDPVLGFAKDDWIEIFGDATRRAAKPTAGSLHQIDTVNGANRTITLKSAPNVGPLGSDLRIRRWDQTGTSAEVGNGVSISGGWIKLEEGVEIDFAPGTYRTGDYWLIPARTANGEGTIEWPTQTVGGTEQPLPQAAHGVRHHYADLALVVKDGNQLFIAGDCRRRIPPLTGLRAEEVAVDNDRCQLPSVETVQDAVDALCQVGHGCAELVIIPRQGWETTFDRIGPNEDGNVCMHVGTFTADKPVVIEGRGHLKLTGAGQGTRIIAPDHEQALVFRGWESVTVRDLYVETRKTTQANDINGALGFINCRSVTVEHVTVKNAPAPVRAASCITVRNTLKASSQTSARIHNCDLHVAYLQVGLLLVNVERPSVENNTLRAAPRPAGLTWEKLVTNKRFRAIIAKHLMALADTGGGVKIDDDVLAAESAAFSIGEMAAGAGTLGESERDAIASAIAASSGAPDEDDVRRILAGGNEADINKLFDTLPLTMLTEVSRTMNTFMRRGRAAGAARRMDANAPLTEAPTGAAAEAAGEAALATGRRALAEVERNALLTVRGHTLAFRAPGSLGDDMVRLFRENVTKTAAIESPADLHREMRRVVDRAILGEKEIAVTGKLRRYLDRLKQNNPSLASRGIVVAGQVAKDVRIAGNTLVGVLQGIRVGVSHRDEGRGEYDYIERLAIVGNTIDVTLSVVAERERYGIFAGNCRSVTVADNRVRVSRFAGANDLHIEGVRLYGYYGPLVLVRQNHLTGFDVGIYYNFMDDLEGLPPHLWLVADNMAEGTDSGDVVEVDARKREGESEADRQQRKAAKRKQVRIEGNAP